MRFFSTAKFLILTMQNEVGFPGASWYETANSTPSLPYHNPATRRTEGQHLPSHWSNSPVRLVGIVDMSKKQQKYEVRAKKLYYMENRERK